MSEVPPGVPEGEAVDESSSEELEMASGEALRLHETDGPGPGQPEPERPASAEWWRIGTEPRAGAADSTSRAAQPMPPGGPPPAGAAPPPAGAAPPPAGAAPPPAGAAPPSAGAAPPWSMPGWGAPPWAGSPQWYGWGGPGWPGGPMQPPTGSAPPAQPRRHPLSWVVVGGLIATIAMVALGLGIGYSVWGGASVPASARNGAGVPTPRIPPFTAAGRGGFLGVRIATTPSLTTTSGAHVEGVVASSPAARAGIVKGDTITGFGTRTVASARTLAIDVIQVSPGTREKVEWVTATGKHEVATVTLASRPATRRLG